MPFLVLSLSMRFCPAVGSIPGYFIDTTTVAIDTTGRLMYWLAYMYPCASSTDPGCKGTGKMDLVIINLDTAVLVDAVRGFCVLSLTVRNGTDVPCSYALEVWGSAPDAGGGGR